MIPLFEERHFEDLPEEHRALAVALANHQLDAWMRSWNFKHAPLPKSIKVYHAMRCMVLEAIGREKLAKEEAAMLEDLNRRLQEEMGEVSE